MNICGPWSKKIYVEEYSTSLNEFILSFVVLGVSVLVNVNSTSLSSHDTHTRNTSHKDSGKSSI